MLEVFSGIPGKTAEGTVAIKLTGTNIQGEVVEHLVHGPLIYDETWQLSVDPSTLQVGDMARALFGTPGIVLTLPPEVV